jgi:hypothetical protein
MRPPPEPGPKKQPDCKSTGKKKSPVANGDASQNRKATVKPPPEPPPTNWRPVVILLAETRDNHGLNLLEAQYRETAIPLPEYPSQNETSVCDQKEYSKNCHKKYQTPICRIGRYYRNLEIVSEQILMQGRKITIEKPKKDLGFQSKGEPYCIEECSWVSEGGLPQA